MIKFHKISYEQFFKDVVNLNAKNHVTVGEETIRSWWENIKLPQRSTKGSAGYDFFAPHGFFCHKDTAIQVPTGIRCEMDANYVLMLFPRSGLGFKYGMHMTNTVGIIDSDYFGADNEGHIMGKFTLENLVNGEPTVYIEEGQAFMQGVFVKFGVTNDDAADGVRKGGFGSTDQKADREKKSKSVRSKSGKKS